MAERSEITRRGAAELARSIAAGELSSSDAVAAHIARIEEVDPRLNAMVVPRFDEARREATEADERLAGARRGDGPAPGPLHGVPITIKESLHMAGTPSTGGLPARRHHRAERDAPLAWTIHKSPTASRNWMQSQGVLALCSSTYCPVRLRRASLCAP